MTCDELLFTDTKSAANHTLQPEDTDFIPFQDHSIHLPRPLHIPILIRQQIKLCSTQRKENKDTIHIHKAKPPCIPVYKDKKHVPVIRGHPSTQPKSDKLPTVLQCQVTKPLQNNLHKSHLKQIHTCSRPESHLYYQHHLHHLDNTEIQLFQDHHSSKATNFTSNTFQDHSTIDNHHYIHCNHDRYQHFQDHINMHQDI